MRVGSWLQVPCDCPESVEETPFSKIDVLGFLKRVFAQDGIACVVLIERQAEQPFGVVGGVGIRPRQLAAQDPHEVEVNAARVVDIHFVEGNYTSVSFADDGRHLAQVVQNVLPR